MVHHAFSSSNIYLDKAIMVPENKKGMYKQSWLPQVLPNASSILGSCELERGWGGGGGGEWFEVLDKSLLQFLMLIFLLQMITFL